MKRFKVYIGQNNKTEKIISNKELIKRLNERYNELKGFTIYETFGVWENTFKKSKVLEIITDNLNYIYIEELCYFLKEWLEQDCIFYTEETIKARLI